MTTPVATQLTVRSADGTNIAVFESGNSSGPVVVAVHGYPDNHSTWDGVAAELGDTYRVITYDVRGAGASDKPAAKAAYRIDRLSEDFLAVIDRVSPDAPIHLLAHDWGSMQMWDSVTNPALASRIASFTSISGPNMDYVAMWFRDRSHLGASLSQLLHSYYMAAFQIPRLPERIVATKLVQKGIARAEFAGRADAATATPVDRSPADLLNGIKLYRANIFQRLSRPHPRPTSVPTLVLAPSDDVYAAVRLVFEAPAPYVEVLTTHEIPGGHWVVTARPDLVALHLRAHIEAHSPAPTKRKARG
jgi:pimeloyl-ACP methyl ester carboxylesterase